MRNAMVTKHGKTVARKFKVENGKLFIDLQRYEEDWNSPANKFLSSDGKTVEGEIKHYEGVYTVKIKAEDINELKCELRKDHSKPCRGEKGCDYECSYEFCSKW